MDRRSTRDFEEFAVARSGALYRQAWALCGDRHRAEDLVQETLAKVYVKWRRIDTPYAYSQRTLMRTFLSQQRRRSSTERPWATIPESAAVEDPTDLSDPCESASRRPWPSSRHRPGGAGAALLGGPLGGRDGRTPGAVPGCCEEPESARPRPGAGREPAVNEDEISTLFQRATRDLTPDVGSLVAGGVRRGRVRQRRRRVVGGGALVAVVLVAGAGWQLGGQDASGSRAIDPAAPRPSATAPTTLPSSPRASADGSTAPAVTAPATPARVALAVTTAEVPTTFASLAPGDVTAPEPGPDRTAPPSSTSPGTASASGSA